MKTGRNYKFWFCTGSQDLYGDECLRKVAEHYYCGRAEQIRYVSIRDYMETNLDYQ